MLAIFNKEMVQPPQELNSPAMDSSKKPKLPQHILQDFLSNHPNDAFSITYGNEALLAYAPPKMTCFKSQRYMIHQTHFQFLQVILWKENCLAVGPSWNFLENLRYWWRKLKFECRMFCGLDGLSCIFMGSLINLSSLIKQYGLSKGTNEAMFVIEAYRTLRDRGPYPADQVLKDLDGSFGFVVYDSKTGNVFAALVNSMFLLQSFRKIKIHELNNMEWVCFLFCFHRND